MSSQNRETHAQRQARRAAAIGGVWGMGGPPEGIEEMFESMDADGLMISPMPDLRAARANGAGQNTITGPPGGRKRTSIQNNKDRKRRKADNTRRANKNNARGRQGTADRNMSRIERSMDSALRRLPGTISVTSRRIRPGESLDDSSSSSSSSSCSRSREDRSQSSNRQTRNRRRDRSESPPPSPSSRRRREEAPRRRRRDNSSSSRRRQRGRRNRDDSDDNSSDSEDDGGGVPRAAQQPEVTVAHAPPSMVYITAYLGSPNTDRSKCWLCKACRMDSTAISFKRWNQMMAMYRKGRTDTDPVILAMQLGHFFEYKIRKPANKFKSAEQAPVPLQRPVDIYYHCKKHIFEASNELYNTLQEISEIKGSIFDECLYKPVLNFMGQPRLVPRKKYIEPYLKLVTAQRLLRKERPERHFLYSTDYAIAAEDVRGFANIQRPFYLENMPSVILTGGADGKRQQK